MVKLMVSDNAPKRLNSIQFAVLEPAATVAMSEFEASTNQLYQGQGNERGPVEGGVLDPRLGTSSKSGTCGTCGEKMTECVGHWGYIRLTLPVFHVGYFREVLRILQCVCKTCSRVLLDEGQRRTWLQRVRRPNLENPQRVAMSRSVTALCKRYVNCPHCGSTNGVVKKIGALKITHERFRAKKTKATRNLWEKQFESAIQEQKELRPHIHKAQDDMNPLRVLNLLKAIPSQDCELLGLDPAAGRPEEYIWQYISVPPVCIRPSVAQDNATNEDDITTKLAEIIEVNQILKLALAKGSSTTQIIDQWDWMSTCCAMYINAETPGLSKDPSNKPIRGFCQRLKGKQGRFRGNLSGKRVDFSGRTVISPDPNLRIDEVAVPELVAKMLTYPDRVTVHNINELRKAIINGAERWPGANFHTGQGPGSFKRILKVLRREKRIELANSLKIGDTVERHLRDGDVVLFNRQPSLHRLSIMSHRVKVRPWRTFRLNECVCTPYNADFDGDEMNLHVPQTEEARTEAAELLNIKQNLVTPRNGEPIIAATQDFITGAYLLSRKDRFLTKAQLTQILSYLDDANTHFDIPPPVIHKPVKLWTGKQVFNLMMRPNKSSNVLVNLESKGKTMEKPSPEFLPDMSPNDGYLVIRNSQIMCGNLDKASVGDGKKSSVFGIILRDYGTNEAAKAMNRLAKLCARWLSNYGFSIGISDVTPGEKLRNEKESLVDDAYKESLDLIAKSRAGKLDNLPGCNADQTLEATISGVLSKVRSAVGDICKEELGMYNSPKMMALCGSKGSLINVAQMVACVGQQIINSNRVPDGFQDRSLPHFPKMARDPPSKGFVRNSFYSGLNGTEFFCHAISGREGLVDTAVKTAETGYMQRRLMKALEDLSTRYDLSVRNSVGGVIQFVYGDDGLDPMYLEGDGIPVEFGRLWSHVKATVPALSSQPGVLPNEITRLSNELLKAREIKVNCTEAFVNTIKEFIDQKVVKPAIKFREYYGITATGSTKIQKGEMTAEMKIVDNKTKVTEQQIRDFIKQCTQKYLKSRIQPGTAVGAVGAQSIGEPGTQMTLKTFHFAGVASMNVTMGVPRIKEIINAAKNISTPIIAAELVSNQSEQAARIVKARIEKTFLGDIASVMAPSFAMDSLYVAVNLDLETIDKLQLEVSIDSIKQSIVAHPKLKIKEGVIQTNKKSKLRVYVEQTSEDPYLRLMEIHRALPHVVIKGIKDCARAVIKEETDDKTGTSRKKLLVEGYGLREIMTTDGVVGSQTSSNHIMEVVKVLGIEAARATIVREINTTMSAHGLSVDVRHLSLLGDTMCFKGEVLGITRFGVAKMKDSVLMLASFEKTTDHLFNAALYGARDTIAGVSECIITGTPPNQCGTSLPSLVASKPKIKPKTSWAKCGFEEAHFAKSRRMVVM